VRKKAEMMRSLKVFFVFVIALGLTAFMGGSSVVMASHGTHFFEDKGPCFFEDKGPGLVLDEIGCYVCHAPGNLQCGPDAPLFDDDPVPQPLATTAVCDPCHSPGGAYNGVTSSGNSVGAKDNWQNGVYEGDGTLQSGKERWCVGCHDDVPANSKADGSGVDAPKVAGDNSTYGYYATGHGAHGLVKCLECHDAGKTHIDHEHRTYYAASNPNNYQAGYRLAKPMKVPRPNYGSPPYPLEHLAIVITSMRFWEQLNKMCITLTSGKMMVPHATATITILK
jgi:hypothetical protein